MKKLKKLNTKGFTLIEMVLVLFVISILMLLIIPNVVTQKEKVDTKGTEALVTVVQTQVELYEMELGTKATSFEMLQSKDYLNVTQVKQANTKLQMINGIVSVKNSAP
ncbi:competence protein ComGC [Carnobacterium iners]|uniref:Competence protein ComGC n=1 Tax=Carnobacterium iners TaxID=1073423 RepID=A0A1X7NRC5_9LACT|nr:competence type IV pilus major pilin ComGC [Carnobacterium iners]SEL15984.1 competence protein ComGC [Carnobacterium iners]SMH40627.1 competence protein ComGC [Carnobacterium iners]